MFEKLMHPTLHKELKRHLSIFFGGVLLATGITMFLVPNQIVSGGTPGAAILVNYFSGVPIGTLMFMINIPMVLMSIKFIGRGFTLRTVFAVSVSAATADILLEVLKLDAWTHEPILGAIFGGICIGLGLGLIMNGSASAGGPSIIARLIANKTHLKEGNLIIALDALIVIAAGFVFASVESALWSLVGVYLSSRALDLLISGRPSKKLIHISSQKVDLLRSQLIHKLGHEGMIIRGVGFDMAEERKLIMLTVDNNKVPVVKRIVEETDKEGLLIIIEASELLGRDN